MTEKRHLRFKRNIRQFLALSAIAIAGAVGAADTAPEAVVRETTSDVLAAIANNPAPATLRQVAESKVVPHFDFRKMTQLAAGRVWNQATPEQQTQLVGEFQRLLVRSYTQSLGAANHSAAKVAVQPSPVSGSDETTVRTTVTEPGRRPVAIDYRMAKSDGNWKVVDVMVENISLVTNYRDWFATRAKEGGVEAVIRSLSEKNRQSA